MAVAPMWLAVIRVPSKLYERGPVCFYIAGGPFIYTLPERRSELGSNSPCLVVEPTKYMAPYERIWAHSTQQKSNRVLCKELRRFRG